MPQWGKLSYEYLITESNANISIGDFSKRSEKNVMKEVKFLVCRTCILQSLLKAFHEKNLLFWRTNVRVIKYTYEVGTGSN